MLNGKIFIFIILFFVIFTLLMVGLVIFIIKAAKKEVEKREEIKSTKPKQNFEYIDFFFSNVSNLSTDNTNNRMYGYFILKDIETSVMYAIHIRNANASYEMISTFNNKKFDLFLNTNPRKNINFNDKGIFWVSEVLDKDFYFRNNNNVKIGVETFKYEGNIGTVNSITRSNILYNLNPAYDISLLDNVKFISGIAEFNIND